MSHVPLRSCVGCRSQRERPQLTRFSRDEKGLVRVDGEGPTQGRGAYLCTATITRCLDLARRRRGLARTLRADHGVIDYPGLLALCEAHIGPSAPNEAETSHRVDRPDLKETSPSPQ